MSNSQIHSRRVELGVVRHCDLAYLEQRLAECARTATVSIEIHEYPVSGGMHVNVDVHSQDWGSVTDFSDFLLANLHNDGTNGSSVWAWTERYMQRVVQFCEFMNMRRRVFEIGSSASY